MHSITKSEKCNEMIIITATLMTTTMVEVVVTRVWEHLLLIEVNKPNDWKCIAFVSCCEGSQFLSHTHIVHVQAHVLENTLWVQTTCGRLFFCLLSFGGLEVMWETKKGYSTGTETD